MTRIKYIIIISLFFRIQEQNAEQLALVKAEHHKEIERLLACHALEHSSSKVAELTNKVNTQEVGHSNSSIYMAMCIYLVLSVALAWY